MKEATNIIKKYKFDDYELKKNFDKAYEDDDFRKIVNDIDMPNEKLISYTSLIMDSAKEIKNCKNCKNILECRNAVNGHVYYPSVLNNEIVFSYIPCKYKKKLDKDTEYQNNIIMIDMPDSFFDGVYNLQRNDRIKIFRSPVFLCGCNSPRHQRHGFFICAYLYMLFFQTVCKNRQQYIFDIRIYQK